MSITLSRTSYSIIIVCMAFVSIYTLVVNNYFISAPNTEMFERTVFIRTLKYNMRIFGVILFVKLQNDT